MSKLVSRLSGTRNCDEPPIPVNEDHLGIVRPSSPEHESNIALRNAIRANPIARRPKTSAADRPPPLVEPHSVSAPVPPKIFAELACDPGFLFVDVPGGSTAYIITQRDNLTAELVTFSPTASSRWPPESSEEPLLDMGWDCAITNSGKETFLNIQADFIVEFDSENPLSVVRRILHTLYVNSLEPGMFRSKYKWQGDKVIGLAEGR